MSGLYRGYVTVPPSTPVDEGFIARAEQAIEAERQRALARAQLPAGTDTTGQVERKGWAPATPSIPIYRGS